MTGHTILGDKKYGKRESRRNKLGTSGCLTLGDEGVDRQQVIAEKSCDGDVFYGEGEKRRGKEAKRKQTGGIRGRIGRALEEEDEEEEEEEEEEQQEEQEHNGNLMLWATALSFPHPCTGREIHLQMDTPEEIQKFVKSYPNPNKTLTSNYVL